MAAVDEAMARLATAIVANPAVVNFDISWNGRRRVWVLDALDERVADRVVVEDASLYDGLKRVRDLIPA